MYMLRILTVSAALFAIGLLLCSGVDAIKAPEAGVAGHPPNGFSNRKLQGAQGTNEWVCSCKICGTQKILTQKICKCCNKQSKPDPVISSGYQWSDAKPEYEPAWPSNESPAQSGTEPEAVPEDCKPTRYAFFKNTCYNPLQMEWVDASSGQTRTAVFLSADGGALVDPNTNCRVELDTRKPLGWLWAGEPGDWRNVELEVVRNRDCGNVQMGWRSSFSC